MRYLPLLALAAIIITGCYKGEDPLLDETRGIVEADDSTLNVGLTITIDTTWAGVIEYGY